jgi:hypothetical protein
MGMWDLRLRGLAAECEVRGAHANYIVPLWRFRTATDPDGGRFVPTDVRGPGCFELYRIALWIFSVHRDIPGVTHPRHIRGRIDSHIHSLLRLRNVKKRQRLRVADWITRVHKQACLSLYNSTFVSSISEPATESLQRHRNTLLGLCCFIVVMVTYRENTSILILSEVLSRNICDGIDGPLGL